MLENLVEIIIIDIDKYDVKCYNKEGKELKVIWK